ncbi:MAG: hypothetical protein IT363_12015 [Methanoregulaceae archaeon]|nr:hypothetical protein [Methanoregulaceae archaeon]
MRLFLGCPIPSEPAHMLEAWADRALPQDSLRITPATNLHVTLAFYGEVEAAQAAAIIAKVAAVPWTPKPVMTGPLRYFGRNAIGLEVDGLLDDPWSPELIELWRLQPERERQRDPRPHVTVARLRPKAMRPTLPAGLVLKFKLPELVLFESRLSMEGSTYLPLARVGGATRSE